MTFDHDVNALVELLAWVEQQIKAMITALIERDPQGAGSLRWLRRRQALLDAMLADVERRSHQALPDIFDAAWRDGLHAAGIDAAFGPGLNRDAVDRLAQGLREDIDAALYTVGRRVRDLFRELTLKQVAIHIVAGTGAKAAAKTLERELVKRGTRAFVDKAGREWSLANYTDMAIRTVTREAMTQGTVSGLEHNGHELVRYSHHEGSCDICLAYDGKTFALPGHNVSGFRTLRPEELPPIHPRCKHVVAPAPERLAAFERELGLASV